MDGNICTIIVITLVIIIRLFFKWLCNNDYPEDIAKYTPGSYKYAIPQKDRYEYDYSCAYPAKNRVTQNTVMRCPNNITNNFVFTTNSNHPSYVPPSHIYHQDNTNYNRYSYNNSNDNGYIYVITNDPYLADKMIVKIGYTKNIQSRIKQLNRETSNYRDFQLLFYMRTDTVNYDKQLHKVNFLSVRRLSPNKEFFKVSYIELKRFLENCIRDDCHLYDLHTIPNYLSNRA